MLIVITLLYFVSAVLLTYYGVPLAMKSFMEINQRRAQKFAVEMDRTMMQDDIRKVSIFYIVGPFIVGGIGFFMAPPEFRFLGAIAGMVVGFIIPKTYANILINRRRQQFDNQLIDGLLIMSSSFRGGLSLIQSMEAIVEEMPDPIRQEIGVVLGENKIGVAMEDALQRLHSRMPSSSLQQVISAILLARSTGGNLPVIFSRIVHSIREKKKLQESLMVLTLQGKLQALVMSALPVGFFLMVNSTNPHYFKVMLETETGRMLLIVCVVLWIVGTFFILKISSFKDF